MTARAGLFDGAAVRSLPNGLSSEESLLADLLGHPRNASGETLDLGEGFSVPDQHEGAQSFKYLRFTRADDGDCVAHADRGAIFGSKSCNVACDR
jgi:hypothetical protein